MAARSRKAVTVLAVSTAVKTVKIGTRGSPLALAQAYMTRDLLKVGCRLVESAHHLGAPPQCQRQ